MSENLVACSFQFVLDVLLRYRQYINKRKESPSGIDLRRTPYS